MLASHGGVDNVAHAGKRPRRIVDPRNVVTRHDLLIIERNAPAHVARNELVVADENLHRHAVTLELRQHIGDIRQDGVREADEAGENEFDLIVARVGVPRLQPAVRDRQNAQTVRAQSLVDRHARLSRGCVERCDLTSRLERGRQAEDRRTHLW